MCLSDVYRMFISREPEEIRGQHVTSVARDKDKCATNLRDDS